MNELGQLVKNMLDGTREELKDMIPQIDLKPEISDKKVKQAILDLTTEGMNKLLQQYGQAEVLDFIKTFSQGRRW